MYKFAMEKMSTTFKNKNIANSFDNSCNAFPLDSNIYVTFKIYMNNYLLHKLYLIRTHLYEFLTLDKRCKGKI